MTNSKSKSNTEKTITLRTSKHQFNRITQEAEAINMNNSAFTRWVVEQHINNKMINIELTRLEKRLERRMFEMVSAIAGLDEHERLKAKNKYLSNLKKENK